MEWSEVEWIYIVFILVWTHQTLTLPSFVVSSSLIPLPCPGSLSRWRPNIETQRLHSPRQVTRIALHCIALQPTYQGPTTTNTAANTYPSHINTPHRRPDPSAPPSPINPLCRRRRLPPSDLPYVCCLLQQKQQLLLATCRNRLMLRNYPRSLDNLPADNIVAPPATGIGFGHAACLAT